MISNFQQMTVCWKIWSLHLHSKNIFSQNSVA